MGLDYIILVIFQPTDTSFPKSPGRCGSFDLQRVGDLMLSVSSMALRFEMDGTSHISWCNKEAYHSSLSISYFPKLVQCKPADVPCVLAAEINSPFVVLETGKRPAVGFKSQHNSRNRYDNGLILYCCRHDQTQTRRESLRMVLFSKLEQTK